MTDPIAITTKNIAEYKSALAFKSADVIVASTLIWYFMKCEKDDILPEDVRMDIMENLVSVGLAIRLRNMAESATRAGHIEYRKLLTIQKEADISAAKLEERVAKINQKYDLILNTPPKTKQQSETTPPPAPEKVKKSTSIAAPEKAKKEKRSADTTTTTEQEPVAKRSRK